MRWQKPYIVVTVTHSICIQSNELEIWHDIEKKLKQTSQLLIDKTIVY